MGQWLRRAVEKMQLMPISPIYFQDGHKNNCKRRARKVRRRRFREIQIYDSDDDNDEYCCSGRQKEDDYLDIFTMEDDYGTIKGFSHRMPLGLRHQSLTPVFPHEDSPSPVSLTKYFAAETAKKSPSPSHGNIPPETENSLDFPNYTQTKYDDTVAGLSFHTPPPLIKKEIGRSSGRGEKDKARCERRLPSCVHSYSRTIHRTIPSSYQNFPTATKYHHRIGRRDNTYFDQLIRALSRKYWTHPSIDESKVAQIPKQKTRACGNVPDDDTFTDVSDLTTKRDIITNNDNTNLKSIPLCTSVSKMQPIAEETLPTKGFNPTTDFYLNEERLSNSPQTSYALPNSPRLSQRNTEKVEAHESEGLRYNHEESDYADDEEDPPLNGHNVERFGCRNAINDDIRCPRQHGATIVKLNMSIQHILNRIRRPGLKVFCYRFWVEANPTTWNAFHSLKDRRIESIGRATRCHIRLKAKTVRQPSGFLKQEVIVYAPTMLALEKCCNLFDEKFPRFYASNELRKLKLIFTANS